MSAYRRERYLTYQRNYNRVNHKTKSYYSWSKKGIKFIDFKHFEKVYDYYINLTECDFCHKEFKSTRDRHLEHLHIEVSDNIRGVVCQRCNNKMSKVDRQRDKVLLELHRRFFKFN